MTVPDCVGCRRRDHLIIERDETVRLRGEEIERLRRELAMALAAWQASEDTRNELARGLLHDLARQARRMAENEG